MGEFEKVIGYESIKEEVMRICDVVKNKGKYEKLGVKMSNGLLLYGEPGVGKTLIASCFIKECKRKSFICRKNLPNGEFVKYIKDIFEKLKITLRLSFFLMILINLQMKIKITKMQKNM